MLSNIEKVIAQKEHALMSISPSTDYRPTNSSDNTVGGTAQLMSLTLPTITMMGAAPSKSKTATDKGGFQVNPLRLLAEQIQKEATS